MSEVEATFLFLSSNIKIVFEIIQNVTRNSFYVPVKNRTERIHDLYYDTLDKKLESQQIQLRARILHEKVYKVTIKALKEIKEKYTNRFELERFWSQEAFNDIINNLSRMNIKFEGAELSYDNDPNTTFCNLGLIVIQNRRTNREIVNAVNMISGQIEFELDLDTTSILLTSNNEIRFCELEIESKKSGNEKNLDKIVSEILKFPEFMPWSHSKLETGMGIKYLFGAKLLVPNSDYDDKNELTMNGIMKISNFLKDNHP